MMKNELEGGLDNWFGGEGCLSFRILVSENLFCSVKSRGIPFIYGAGNPVPSFVTVFAGFE